MREVLRLQADRRTGALHVECAGAHVYLYLRGGAVISAEEGTLGETLGRILLARGALSVEQYRAIIERMTEGLIADEQMRFGEVAVELGFLTSEAVRDALAEQVRQRLLRCLSWEDPLWEFHESPSWLEGIGRFPTPFEPVVLDAVRASSEPRVFGILAPYRDRFVWLPSSEAQDVVRRFALQTEDARLLEGLDGLRTLAELVGDRRSPLARLLAALVLAQVPAFHDAPRPARFQVQAPRPAAPPPPPTPPPPPPPPSVERPARKPTPRPSPASMRHAAPPPSSVEPGSQRARLEAEKSFLKGRELLAGNDFARAQPLLAEAARLHPDAAEYAVYAGWAELNVCAEADRPRLHRALRVATSTAVRHDGGFAFGIYVLGHLALRDDRADLAERYFRRASQLDPKLVDAARHVVILERRRRERR